MNPIDRKALIKHAKHTLNGLMGVLPLMREPVSRQQVEQYIREYHDHIARLEAADAT